jgi:hypothetical protein
MLLIAEKAQECDATKVPHSLNAGTTKKSLSFLYLRPLVKRNNSTWNFLKILNPRH